MAEYYKKRKEQGQGNNIMYRVKRFSANPEDRRITFTHSTQIKNLNSILRKGLLGSRSHSKDAITNMSRNMTGSNKDLVYLSNNNKASNFINRVNDLALGGGKVLHISIPISEFRKMKVVRNPEFLGADTYEEFLDRYKYKYKDTLGESKIPSRNYWKMMNENTTVIEGDIPSKYIVESPNYIGD